MLFILGHLVEIIFWQGYLLNVNFWITNIKHLLSLTSFSNSEEVGEYFNAYFGVQTIWEVNKSEITLFNQEQTGWSCRSSSSSQPALIHFILRECSHFTFTILLSGTWCFSTIVGSCLLLNEPFNFLLNIKLNISKSQFYNVCWIHKFSSCTVSAATLFHLLAKGL